MSLCDKYSSLQTEQNFDYVYIYDGDSPQSPQLGAGVYSGQMQTFSLSSSSNNLLVKLTSDGTQSEQGFHALFEFNEIISLGDNGFCTDQNICNADEGGCSSDSHCAFGLECGTDNCDPQLGFQTGINCCHNPYGDSLEMENGTGSLSSPGFPNLYGPNIAATWLLEVPVNHTITLQFTAFSVSVM